MRAQPPPEVAIELVARVQALEVEVARLQRITGIAGQRPVERAAPVPSRLETTVGSDWSGRAGAAALAGAVILAAVWAHERGWLTPAVRYLGDGLVAAAVFWLGARLAGGPRHGIARVGRAIAFIGAAGLFVVPAAAHRLDALIGGAPAAAATLLLAATLIAGAARGTRYLASFAVAGAAALPLWWSPLVDAPVATLVFLATLGAIATGAQRGQGRADVWTAGFAAAFHARWLIDGGTGATAVAVGAGLWAVGLLYSARHRRRLEDPAWNVALTAIAAAAGAGLLFGTTASGPAQVVIAAVLIAIQLQLLEHDRSRRTALIVLVAIAVASLGDGAGSAATAATAASLLPLPFWAVYVRAARRPGELDTDEYLLGHCAAAVIALGWGMLAREWDRPWASAPALAAMSILWLILAAVLARRDDRTTAAGWARVSGTVAGGAAVLAALSYLSLARPTASMLATAVAVVASVSLVAAGLRQRSLIPRLAGLVGLAVTVAKAIAIDLWYLSAGTRVGALAALGAGLLGASFLYGRSSDRTLDRGSS